MSPTVEALLRRAEQMAVRDAAHCRRWYRRTGMAPWQVRHYGDRRNWPDAVSLLRTNGPGPYADWLPYCPH